MTARYQTGYQQERRRKKAKQKKGLKRGRSIKVSQILFLSSLLYKFIPHLLIHKKRSSLLLVVVLVHCAAVPSLYLPLYPLPPSSKQHITRICVHLTLLPLLENRGNPKSSTRQVNGLLRKLLFLPLYPTNRPPPLSLHSPFL